MRREAGVTFRKIAFATVAAASLVSAQSPAGAENIITEIRGGIYDHDASMFGTRYETAAPDINLEMRFATPGFLSWAFSPNPVLGADINTGDGTSLAYLGLGWDIYFTDHIFLDFTLGGAIHDGKTGTRSADSADYGCRLNFHESVSIGYNFDGSNSIMLSVDHMSNARLCEKNDGLTNFGIRYAYKF